LAHFISAAISKVDLISSLVGTFREAPLYWIAQLFSGAEERQNVFEKRNRNKLTSHRKTGNSYNIKKSSDVFSFSGRKVFGKV
jgi:hypothetical protein